MLSEFSRYHSGNGETRNARVDGRVVGDITNVLIGENFES